MVSKGHWLARERGQIITVPLYKWPLRQCPHGAPRGLSLCFWVDSSRVEQTALLKVQSMQSTAWHFQTDTQTSGLHASEVSWHSGEQMKKEACYILREKRSLCSLETSVHSPSLLESALLCLGFCSTSIPSHFCLRLPEQQTPQSNSVIILGPCPHQVLQGLRTIINDVFINEFC